MLILGHPVALKVEFVHIHSRVCLPFFYHLCKLTPILLRDHSFNTSFISDFFCKKNDFISNGCRTVTGLLVSKAIAQSIISTPNVRYFYRPKVSFEELRPCLFLRVCWEIEWIVYLCFQLYRPVHPPFLLPIRHHISCLLLWMTHSLCNDYSILTCW